MYTVYKHTSPCGKVYIGITAQSVNNRWRNGNGYNHSPHFNCAIKKYGWDNIQHEILYTGLTKEQAEEKEKYLIAFFKSNDRKYGYNSDSGGSVNRFHSEETKEKIRKAHIGMKYGKEFREKISSLKLGNKNRLGQKQSESCKQKISCKNKGRFAGEKNYFHSHKFYGADSPMAKAVKRFDLNGNYIDSRESISDYVKELNLINGSHITEVCKGKRRKAHGYIWCYKEVS